MRLERTHAVVFFISVFFFLLARGFTLFALAHGVMGLMKWGRAVGRINGQ